VHDLIFQKICRKKCYLCGQPFQLIKSSSKTKPHFVRLIKLPCASEFHQAPQRHSKNFLSSVRSLRSLSPLGKQAPSGFFLRRCSAEFLPYQNSRHTSNGIMKSLADARPSPLRGVFIKPLLEIPTFSQSSARNIRKILLCKIKPFGVFSSSFASPEFSP